MRYLLLYKKQQNVIVCLEEFHLRRPERKRLSNELRDIIWKVHAPDARINGGEDADRR